MAEIIEQKENTLFKRKEVKIAVTEKDTLSKTEAEEIVAKLLSAKPEQIKIKKIDGQFGSSNFVVDANVYSSQEEKDKIEVKTKQELEAERKAAEEAAKAEAEAKKAAEEAAKAAETPAEENTEEKTE